MSADAVAARRQTVQLQNFWAAKTNQPMNLASAEEMTRFGWTTDLLADALTLADRAVEEDTGVAVLARADKGWNAGRLRSYACDRLIAAAVTTQQAEVPLKNALAWMVIAAGAPDKNAVLAMPVVITDAFEAVRDRRLDRIRAWHSAVGSLAPLAYAAGLEIEEANAQQQSSALDPEALRVLAGLRGWHLF